MAAALLVATLSVLSPAHAQPGTPTPLTAADLPRLQAELARVTAHAQQLSAALDRAAARDGGLRVAYGRLEQARADAQLALDTRARQVYIAGTPSPIGDWQSGLAAPDLRELSHRAERAALTVDRGLVDAVTSRAAQLKTLQQQANAFRLHLLAQAQSVLADQDRARELLAQAQALADALHAADLARQLEAQRQLLDDVSTAVTLALTPAQSARSRTALANQAPVIALLEQTGAGIPVGYAPSGQTFSGTASWYGPGFVGRPTASGAPYDPERLTCANKELPLGTVIHVSSGGYAINCLVNDRGPYVGDRILDMSRAGSRALGYSGLAQVTLEVLLPT
ncbi:MAG: septal ring lytic transglycosylase RlpA family lipoprotein [Frankiales bacterium]|nr:septal ring lytic transglycosylase RlpA family lipoprotein [Frankiales bacterium]